MISTRELMIGDWVTQALADGTSFGVVKQMQPHMFTQCNFEPIPLTPEILAKNGFWVMENVDNGAEEYMAYAIDGLTFHYNRDNDFYFPNTPISWKYVHELQRVLRCCGLWELAYNFIID